MFPSSFLFSGLDRINILTVEFTRPIGYRLGYTARHLHQRIAEHKYSSIDKHLLEAHGDKNLLNEGQFRVLEKCHGKFDCLVYEMLFIQELKPSLNTQSDSISAKLFV